MKTIHAAFFVSVFAFVADRAPALAADPVSAVMIKGHEIFELDAGKPLRQLTDDGAPKSLPTWSQDGARIAYIEGASRQRRLKVIGLNGAAISDTVLPTSELTGDKAGLRAVENIEWVATDKVVVSGSLNPGTTAYMMFDAGSGAEVAQFFDDGAGAAFSPDGAHYAFISGSPHFTPVAERAPQLELDGRVLIAGLDPTADLTPIHWASEGDALAIGTYNSDQTGASSDTIYVYSAGTTHKIALPSPSAGSSLSLFWSGADLIAELRQIDGGMTTGAWRLAPPNFQPKQAPLRAVGGVMRPAVVDPTDEARALAFSVHPTIRNAGGAQADLWCAACALKTTPASTRRRLLD